MINTRHESTRRPAVSIIVLAWNRISEVRQTLEQISESSFDDYEVILIDNASTDGTAEMVEHEFPHVNLIKLPVNRGIYGYNVGFANARGSYIVVLDDDSHPAPDALEKVVSVFQADQQKSIGVIAFHIINNIIGRDVTSSWPEGECITFWGCGAAIRSEVLETSGYYDEDFFIYANEYDLSIRILEAGWRVEYRPDIIAYHRECKKHRSAKRDGWIGARNEAWFHLKHFPWWTLPLLAIWASPKYIWRGINKRSKELAFYSLAGYLRGYISFRIPLAKRKPISFRTTKLFFKNHWFFTPVSKLFLSEAKRVQ